MNEVVVNHLDGENGLTNKIKDAMNEVSHQFIYIGFLLKEAADLGYYREGGYDNIYDYCEDNFGFGRSSTNNFIRVYRQFGSNNGIGLLDSYKAYNYSQLTEMCSMNVKQLNECNPYMTVRELRTVKKGTKPMKLESTVEPDEPPEVKEPESSRQSGRIVYGCTGPVMVQFPRDFVIQFFNRFCGGISDDWDSQYFQTLGNRNGEFLKHLFNAIGYKY